MIATRRDVHSHTISEFEGIAINLVLTNKCNYRCRGCYMHNDEKEKVTMSHDCIKKCIDLAYYLSPHNAIALFGGEPTLEMELAEYCVQHNDVPHDLQYIANLMKKYPSRITFNNNFEINYGKNWKKHQLTN